MAVVVVVVVVGLAALGAIWWYRYQAQQKRIAALAEFAQDVGFEFAVRDPHNTIGLPFALFKRGDGRRVEHVMWGDRNGLPMRIFDYWYYDESSDGRGNRSRTYHRYTGAVLSIAADCPTLRIGHEGVMSRIGSALGFKDVELEYDDFNREYRVNCDDQKFAFSLLDGRMMEWLLRVTSIDVLEVVGPFVLIAAPQLAPERWRTLVQVAEEFHERVPQVVWTTWPRGPE
jgi:hypothetical protein